MSLVPKWIWTLMRNCNAPETLQHLLQQSKVIVKIEAALQHNITQDESHHLLGGFLVKPVTAIILNYSGQQILHDLKSEV